MIPRRDGNESIVFNGEKTEYHLSDFWAWCFSDLMNNTLRGAYCEFLVATALELDLSAGREDWAPWDLTVPLRWKNGDTCRDEIHIEVKSCAYLQSWKQSKLSAIRFSIQPTLAWNEESGYDKEARRQSDVYVFGLYTITDRAKVDPLILDGWKFFIVPTSVLNDRCGNQKTISLHALEKLGPIMTDYAGLKDAVFQSVDEEEAWPSRRRVPIDRNCRTM